MEQKPKVRICDSGFTPYVKSASLREENKDVSPTYFEWDKYIPNYPPDPKFYTDGNIKYITMYEIAWLIEPRCLRPENYELAENPDRQIYMEAILTYDKKLLDECPNASFYPLGGSSIAFDKWGMYPKQKQICMILSDKKTTEGHKLRHQIYEKYKDSGLIDFYGAGARKSFESKFEILKDYRFCIVVESCQLDFYWTEKLIDALSMGCVVYYWGCPSILQYFDFNTVKPFGTLEELKTRYLDVFLSGGSTDLNAISEYQLFSEPERMLPNMEEAKKYRICEDQIFELHPGLFQ